MARVVDPSPLSEDVLTLITSSTPKVPSALLHELAEAADCLSPIIAGADGIPLWHANSYLRKRSNADLDFGSGVILAPISRRTYANDLCYFLNTYREPSPSVIDLHATNAKLIAKYTEHLESQDAALGFSAISRRRMIAIEFCQYLHGELKETNSSSNACELKVKSLISQDSQDQFFHTSTPPGQQSRRRSPRLLTILPPKYLRDFFDAFLDPTHKLIAKLIFATGMRRGEIVKLRTDQILNMKPLHPGGPAYITIIGKGNKERIVELESEAQRLILKYLSCDERLRRLSFIEEGKRSTAPVFLNKFGNSMSGKAVAEAFFSTSNRASVKRTPHELRHEFAAHYLMNAHREVADKVPEAEWLLRLMLARSNAIIDRLSKLLGHSSTETTKRIYLAALIDAEPAIRTAWNAHLDSILGDQ